MSKKNLFCGGSPLGRGVVPGSGAAEEQQNPKKSSEKRGGGYPPRSFLAGRRGSIVLCWRENEDPAGRGSSVRSHNVWGKGPSRAQKPLSN